jgi:hypothetical protein
MRSQSAAAAGGARCPHSSRCTPVTARFPTRRQRVALPVAWSLCALLQGCSGDGAGDRGPLARGDLSEPCERALETTDAAPVRQLAWTYSPDLAIGDEIHPLGRVVGAAWHPGQRRLYVLDALNQRVATYDARGAFLGSFGRKGDGPGEFDELGNAHGSRPVYNQLALLGESHLVVNDFRVMHVFDSGGRFIGRLGTGGAQAGPHAIRHLASFSDSTVLFAETGAMRLETSDRDVRAGLRLMETFLRRQAVDTARWGRMRNTLYRFGSFKEMPPRDPYGGYFRRTWDAVGSGVLAITSQSRHGVCFFDREGQLKRAFRVDAPVIRVDQAERSRIQNDLRKSLGPTIPMIGGSWENFYEEWPEIVPPYVDIALAPDSIAWVERPVPGGAQMVDLYHVERGYLGSREPLGQRLPITFSPGCAFIVDEQIPARVRGNDYFYGLRRWCRAAAPAAASAVGAGPSVQREG